MKQLNSIDNSVTVITVTLNDTEALEETIQSVKSQSYHNINHVIVDGGSVDGSQQLIKSHMIGEDKWISEPDKGIYDAMNKGVSMATGQWVNFLNAGDKYTGSDIVEQIVSHILDEDDLVYGATRFIGDADEEIISAVDLDKLWQAMIFNHNSLFVKRKLMEIHPFNLEYKIVADSEFIIWCYKNGYTFKDTGITVNNYKRGGYADENSILRTIERWKLVAENNMIDKDELNKYYFQRLLWEDFYKEYMLDKYSIKL